MACAGELVKVQLHHLPWKLNDGEYWYDHKEDSIHDFEL